MRFIVYDLGDNRHRLSVDWTTWRATLELLNRHGVIDKPGLNRLVWRLGGAGTSIPQTLAAAIADYLKTRLIPTLEPGHLVHVDGATEFDAVTDGTTFGRVHTSSTGVGLQLEWLEDFAELCGTCRGLGALQEGVERTSRHRGQDRRGGGAVEQADEADEALGGTVAGSEVPPRARAVPHGRGHRFAADLQCWADLTSGPAW
jgi:hypothetical protein